MELHRTRRGNMSFTLSREGLKPGQYIPLRLRFVDTFSIASGVPLLALVFYAWIQLAKLLKPLWPAVVLQNDAIAFFAILLPLFFLCIVSIGRFWEFSLRVLFTMIGLLSVEEAKHFPLAADKRRCDPWPESWQRQINPYQDVDGS